MVLVQISSIIRWLFLLSNIVKFSCFSRHSFWCVIINDQNKKEVLFIIKPWRSTTSQRMDFRYENTLFFCMLVAYTCNWLALVGLHARLSSRWRCPRWGNGESGAESQRKGIRDVMILYQFWQIVSVQLLGLAKSPRSRTDTAGDRLSDSRIKGTGHPGVWCCRILLRRSLRLWYRLR